jgi:hypothetical protein
VEGLGYLPDDGGEVVTLLGAWADLDHTVRFRSGPWLSDPLYSARPGRGSACRPVGNRLSFTSPPCAPGDYDVVVTDLAGTSYVTLDAFLVVYRGQCSEVNRLRRCFPSDWATGPALPRLGIRIEAGNEAELRAEFPLGGLRALTLALGQEIQSINGRPETALRGSASELDSTLAVESTLGFPDEGAVFVEGRAWTYTSKTDTLFAGAAPLYILGKGHPDGASVSWARGRTLNPGVTPSPGVPGDIAPGFVIPPCPVPPPLWSGSSEAEPVALAALPAYYQDIKNP